MVTLIIIALIANITRSKGRSDVHILDGAMPLKTNRRGKMHTIRRADYGQQKIQIKERFDDMRYENMTFTDNDKVRLKENRNAICNWIIENIVPVIDDNSSLHVDFGDIYRCPRSGTPIETYHFVVYGSEHSFYFMGDRGKGYIGYGQKFGGCHEPFEKAYSPYDIFPIVDNWKMIKNKLLSMASEQKKAKESIYSFEV